MSTIITTLVLAFSVVLLLAIAVAAQHRRTQSSCKACEHFGEENAAEGEADADAEVGEEGELPSWVEAKARNEVRGRVDDPRSIEMHDQDRLMVPLQERFDHYEPDRSVLARDYGMDYVPATVWSVPQFRPPPCHQRECGRDCPSAISTPYTTVQEAATDTSVGSILPTFEYRETPGA